MIDDLDSSEAAEAMKAIEVAGLDGWWDWRPQDGVEYFSDRFWEILGYDPKQMPNSPDAWQDKIHPDDLPRAIDDFYEHERTKGAFPYHMPVRYKHAKGHWVHVICRGQIVQWDKNGKALRMVGTHTDITELVELRSELQDTANELQGLKERIKRRVDDG